MVSREELLALAPVAIDIPGGGHNIHVQHPQAFVDHLLDFVTVTGALGNVSRTRSSTPVHRAAPERAHRTPLPRTTVPAPRSAPPA